MGMDSFIDPGGYWWPPTYSNWLLMSIFVQHVFLYCFIIVSYTLLGLSEASHILQVDTGGLSPNPTGLILYVFMSAHLVVLSGLFWGPKHCFFDSPQSDYRQSQSLMEKCVVL
jgi:hypothetical protein